MSAFDSQNEGAALLTIPMGGGIRQDVAPESVPIGDFLELRNLTIERHSSNQRRPGFDLAANASKTVKKVCRYRDGYIYVDEFGRVYTYDSFFGEKATYGWTSNAMGVRRSLVEMSNASCGDATVVQYGTYRYYVWVTQNGTNSSVWLCCVNESGVMNISPTELVYGSSKTFFLGGACLVGSGPYMFLAYVDGAGGTSTLYRHRVNLATLVVDAAIGTETLFPDFEKAYDCAPVLGNATEIAEAYFPSGTAVPGPFTLKLRVRDGASSSLTVTKTRDISSLAGGATGPAGVGIYAADAKFIWYAFGYQDGSAPAHALLKYGVVSHDSSLTVVKSATTVDDTTVNSGACYAKNISIHPADSAHLTTTMAWSWWSTGTGSGGYGLGMKYAHVDWFTPAVNVYQSAWGYTLLSKLFCKFDYGSTGAYRIYAIVGKPNGVTGNISTYVVRLKSYANSHASEPIYMPIACLAPRGGGYGVSNNVPSPRMSGVVNVAANLLSACTGGSTYTNRRYYTAMCVSSLSAPSNEFRVAMAEAEIDFSHPGLFRSVEVAGALYIGGGVLNIFDGRRVCESGFLEGPAPNSATSTPRFAEQISQTTGGGLTLLGTYNFEHVWEQSHANGDIARSQPSLQLTKTLTGSNNKVTIVSECPVLTSRDIASDRAATVIAQAIYRTTDGGSELYREKPDLVTAVNDVATTVGYVADAFSTADTNVATNPLIYTTGGVVENVCPSSTLDIWLHKNRLWAIGDDGRTIWMSKTKTEGECIAFADEFAFQMPDAGACTAGRSLDDFCVIFKAQRIYALYGDGPGDTDQGSDLSDPQLISQDIGCIDCRSVTRIPSGLMFQARNGIYLLTRNRELAFVGERVQQFTSDYPVCVGAETVESKNHARFVMQNSAGTTSVILVYDYNFDKWFQWDLSSGYLPVQSSCVLADGTYMLGRLNDGSPTAGFVLRCTEQDTSPTYADYAYGGGTTEYYAYAVTSWIRPSDIVGYHRFQRFGLLARPLGSSASGGIKISFALNYVDSYNANTITFASATVYAANSPAPWIFCPPVQKAQAIKLKIEHVLGGASSNWVELLGLTCKVIPKTGLFKNVGSAQKGG